MSNESCRCRFECFGLSLIISIAVGVLAAVFRYIAIITVTPAFLWVLFGIAIGYLGITLATSGRYSPCVCRNLPSFLVGILGTILTSIILLGITFAATSVIGAIITGALLFFFTFTLINAVCIINCGCD